MRFVLVAKLEPRRAYSKLSRDFALCFEIIKQAKFIHVSGVVAVSVKVVSYAIKL